ncbi:unnamed protein product [Amoebophrya sp. A120]|nr:unnamed protein product [Amoebophrya sp. A120]|eukprot:GSA120T00011654001.1
MNVIAWLFNSWPHSWIGWMFILLAIIFTVSVYLEDYLLASQQAEAQALNAEQQGSSEASLLDSSKLWRKLRKRRLKKLRESPQAAGETDKADQLIHEYRLSPEELASKDAAVFGTGGGSQVDRNQARLDRILCLHAKEINLLDMPFPQEEVDGMASELEQVIRALTDKQRAELVGLYWNNEYGIRACRDLLLRLPLSSLQVNSSKSTATSKTAALIDFEKIYPENHSTSASDADGTASSATETDDVAAVAAVASTKQDKKNNNTSKKKGKDSKQGGNNSGKNNKAGSSASSSATSSGTEDGELAGLASSGGIADGKINAKTATPTGSTTTSAGAPSKERVQSDGSWTSVFLAVSAALHEVLRPVLDFVNPDDPLSTEQDSTSGDHGENDLRHDSLLRSLKKSVHRATNELRETLIRILAEPSEEEGTLSVMWGKFIFRPVVLPLLRVTGLDCVFCGETSLFFRRSNSKVKPDGGFSVDGNQQNQLSPATGTSASGTSAAFAQGAGTSTTGQEGGAGNEQENTPDSLDNPANHRLLKSIKNIGEYFVPLPQNECMAHVKLLARKVLRSNHFSAHECDAILYRSQFQHLKGVPIKGRLFSPTRVQHLRAL